MKKHCVLLICIVFATARADAQRSGFKTGALPGKPVSWAASMSPAKTVKDKPTAKTSAALRLSAIARYNLATAPASLIDSERYAYSGARGWDTDDPVAWDTADYYVVPATPGQKYVQTFDAHDNILSLTAMTADGAGGWNNNTKDTFTYDGADHILKHIAYQWDIGGGSWSMVSDMNYYYGSSLLDSTVTAIYLAGSYEEGVKEAYTYNSRHIVAAMLESTRNAVAADWEPSRYISRNFDAADELVLSEKTSDYAGGAWNDVLKSEYTYDASGNRMTQSMLEFDGADWIEYQRTLNSYNASDKLTESLVIDMDAAPLPDSTRDSYTYNVANLIADITTEALDHTSSSFMPLTKSSYYYDDKVTAITEMNHGGVLSVYPAPANNELTLDLQWDKVQQATAAITDLQGRVWQQWTLPAVQQHKEQVALNNLPSGNYVLRISGSDNARVTQQFTMVR